MKEEWRTGYWMPCIKLSSYSADGSYRLWRAELAWGQRRLRTTPFAKPKSNADVGL